MKLDSSGLETENLPAPKALRQLGRIERSEIHERQRHNEENDTNAEVCAVFEFGSGYVAHQYMGISAGKRFNPAQSQPANRRQFERYHAQHIPRNPKPAHSPV